VDKPISCHCIDEKNKQVRLASADIKKMKGVTYRTLEEAVAVWMGHFNAKTFRARLRFIALCCCKMTLINT
jgi:hypothetical protein